MARLLGARAAARVVALTDEFLLKGLFPFFATFLHRARLRPGGGRRGPTASDAQARHRGGQRPLLRARCSSTTGWWPAMAERGPDFLFLPHAPRACRASPASGPPSVCPIVQARPDLLRLRPAARAGRAPRSRRSSTSARAASTRRASWRGCRALAARARRADGRRWRAACARPRGGPGATSTRPLPRARAQRALDFCREARRHAGGGAGARLHHLQRRAQLQRAGHPARAGGDRHPGGLLPGRRTTRRSSTDMFWGYGQRILRAAQQVRRTPGVYSLFCSNYSCGPDSFTLHFFAYAHGGQALRHHRDRRPLRRRRHQDPRRGLPPLRARGPAGQPRRRGADDPAGLDGGRR